jgi:LPS-assembly lipoprotein
MNKIFSRSLLLVIAFLISACGWQLRGNMETANLQSLHVDSFNPQGVFTKELDKALHKQGVNLEKNSTNAQTNLVILDQNSERRVATVSGSARAAQYLLIESVTFTALDQNGNELIDGTTLSSERLIDFDENQVIGMQSEADTIRTELRQDLIRLIMSRLQHLPATAGTTAAE